MFNVITKNKGTNDVCSFYPLDGTAKPLLSLFPQWAQSGGSDELIKKLMNKEIRKTIREEMPNDDDSYWDSIVLKEIDSELYKPLVGKNIRQIGQVMCRKPFNTACDLILDTRCMVNVIVKGR